MSEHSHGARIVERHSDVAVIGGTVAGLAAALQLVLKGRSVIVVDAGEPQDAHAAEREQVRSHGGEVLAARSTGLSEVDDGHVRVALTGGHGIVARRVLDAAGLTDAEDGTRTGTAISRELTGEDIGAAARPAANEADWDQRYSGDRVWSGNPNGTLVREMTGVTPGRALDVGAGEGGDAVWLAEQGWAVTANDVSQRALGRVRAEAERRGLTVDVLHANANTPGAFPAAAFDLVSAQYAAIPRTPDDRGLRNLLEAVARGGTLLVVSHDIEPMRAPIDTRESSRMFDADAYVRVEDVAAALAGAPGWDVVCHEQRPRPPGSATAAQHVDDVVLRARRD